MAIKSCTCLSNACQFCLGKQPENSKMGEMCKVIASTPVPPGLPRKKSFNLTVQVDFPIKSPSPIPVFSVTSLRFEEAHPLAGLLGDLLANKLSAHFQDKQWILGKEKGSGASAGVHQLQIDGVQRVIKVFDIMRKDIPAFLHHLDRGEILLNQPGNRYVPEVFGKIYRGAENVLLSEYEEGSTLIGIVMEDGGEPLSNYLQNGHPNADPISIAKQIAEGLLIAKEKYKSCHRDIKPGNILINSEGRVKICDWGLSRKFSPGDAAPTRGIGTEPYQPPEYSNEDPFAADVWSIGVIFYVMLYMENPFKVWIDKLGEVTYPKTPYEGLVPIIQKLLVAEPGKRMTIEKLFDELQKIASPQKTVSKESSLEGSFKKMVIDSPIETPSTVNSISKSSTQSPSSLFSLTDCESETSAHEDITMLPEE